MTINRAVMIVPFALFVCFCRLLFEAINWRS